MVSKNILKIALLALSVVVSGYTVAKNHEVKLLTADASGQMMLMEPAFLSIDAGDTVTFIPADPTHNVESIGIPTGADSFVSGMGKKVTVTFTQPGGYLYKCTPHLMMGMIGVIQVETATNKSALISQWQALAPQVVMNKERGMTLLSQLNE